MYRLKLEHHIDSAHKLELDYESKCQRVHGHRWNIIIQNISDIIEGRRDNHPGLIFESDKLNG